MNRRHILLGSVILAAVILGGAWLIVQRAPLTQEARERKCIEDQRRVLIAAYIKLKEGVTWEEFEAEMLAYCNCFAREANRQLTPQELAAIDRRQSTPAIDAKLVAIMAQCSPKIRELTRRMNDTD
ncbi:MAG TPA: hypothetical protein VG742_14935 [Dongiaceae bacterium]|nr:hypothetical protein [Dongiaceae bacterium]